MKRLTKRGTRKNGYVSAIGSGSWCWAQIIDRLAAYEDTGLMPEEIRERLAILPPPCYKPDGDGCAYQVYDGDDEPIDRCKECPLCYSDKQRHQSPPNTPLTLEELREMDGEPVWLSWAGHPEAGWALVCVRSKQNDVIYLRGNQGVTDLVGFILRDGGKIYRRKPEEGMKWQP